MLIRLTRNDMVFKKHSMMDHEVKAVNEYIQNLRDGYNLVVFLETDEEIVVKANRSIMYLMIYNLSLHHDIEL